MAKTTKTKKTTKKKSKAKRPFHVQVRRLFWRSVAIVFLLVIGLTCLFAVVNPPTTPYMFSEGRRIGPVQQTWVSMEDIAPVMARSAGAAEDANF